MVFNKYTCKTKNFLRILLFSNICIYANLFVNSPRNVSAYRKNLNYALTAAGCIYLIILQVIKVLYCVQFMNVLDIIPDLRNKPF